MNFKQHGLHCACSPSHTCFRVKADIWHAYTANTLSLSPVSKAAWPLTAACTLPRANCVATQSHKGKCSAQNNAFCTRVSMVMQCMSFLATPCHPHESPHAPALAPTSPDTLPLPGMVVTRSGWGAAAAVGCAAAGWIELAAMLAGMGQGLIST